MPTWDLWLTLQTQWRHGMGGPTGLDYTAVRATMQLAGIRRRERATLFAGIRAMEMAVLEVWAEKRKD